MIDRLPSQHVVLLGIGHTNAHVLRMWGMQPFADADLTCITNFPVATYSGMLPAVMAGQAKQDQMEIDLVRLCASVGARLICQPVVGLDHDRREVLFDDRPAVAYDALSIGIGSVPTASGLAAGMDKVVKIKPMQTFLQRLGQAVDAASESAADASGDRRTRQLRIMVVGGGVAGVEISFCLSPLVRERTKCDPLIQLVTRSETVLPDGLASTRRRVVAVMQRRGIVLTTGRSVTEVASGRAVLDDAATVDADIVIWATGAVGPEALDRFGLPLDDRGFIQTDSTLRSVLGVPVFAVGDTGTIVDHQLPKAGVYAVRQGPVLWENLARTLSGKPLQSYVPQRSFLRLINRGDGHAIGQWKGITFSGRWAMRLKQSIDLRFMKMFQPDAMMDDAGEPMQCRGCGCKLGGDLLQSALSGEEGSEIKLEDAAEIGGDSDHRLVASTDFFSSPFDDAFLTGRVVALHAASDIVATGAVPTHALANVVLPEGDGRSQQRLLRDFLAGSRLEFAAMGAAIVGGHTIVGPRMEVGFTVIGKAIGRSLVRKENLVPGDQILLTKPLGIGIQLAAHHRSECRADDFESLIAAMLIRQHSLASIAIECGIHAGTDVTGFGLAGHLLEMLDSSGVSARIQLAAIPLLPGVEESIERGIESSLAPDNRRVQSKISVNSASRRSPFYQALFDPQTCGGLVLGVAVEKKGRFLDMLADAGLDAPVCIGEARPQQAGEKPLSIV